jgi:hypothetical protein
VIVVAKAHAVWITNVLIPRTVRDVIQVLTALFPSIAVRECKGMFVEEVVSEKDVMRIIIAQVLRSIATRIKYVQNQPVQQKPQPQSKPLHQLFPAVGLDLSLLE